MSMSNIKTDLVDALSTIPNTSVSYDYSTAAESEKAIVIESLDMSYQHDLDMGWHKELTVNAVLITKTATDLDSLIDALEGIDNLSEGCIRDLMLEAITMDNKDEDVYIASATLSCLVWDVASDD